MTFNISDHISKTDLRKFIPCDIAPGLEGWEVELTYLSKDALQRLHDRNTKPIWDKRLKARANQLNEDGLYRDWAKHVIKGWTGLTVGMLKRLVPIKADVPDNTEVAYSHENVVALLKGAVAFDSWVAQMATDPAIFMDEEDMDENEEAITKN